MTKRVFPIRTESACLLKWAWSTVYFNSGTSASCHRTQKYAIDPDNFDNFHNLPAKIQAREQMLAGQWPGAGCEYCKNVEQVGGVSDRVFNQRQENESLVPIELINNPAATQVTPTILEVYFRNTCNMACVYCGPHFSSLWEEENRKFKTSFENAHRVFDIKQAQHNPDYDRMIADLWQYLETDDRFKSIQRYHILGGEPFLMPELDSSIEFWQTHPNPDLTFSVVTNLNIPTARFERYIKQFERLVLGNKIWRLQLTASLDCWGAEQEYVRYGLDLAQWQKNFELLLNRPWVQLSINSAISALTIKSLPNLLERINQWNTQQTATVTWHQRKRCAEPILHSFNTSGELDDPYVFGADFFDQDFKQILKLMPESTATQQAQKLSMSGIAKRMSTCQLQPIRARQLQDYLSTLDGRRKTNWRSHFAWLDQDFSV